MPNEKPKFSLMIATPFYEVKAYAPYVMSLSRSIKALEMLGIDWYFEMVIGDSYVERAKNTLVHRFLKSDYTHLMIIDSDMEWDVEGFGRLIKDAMAGFDLVLGLYPCKNLWNFFGGWPNLSEDGQVMGKEIPEMDIRVLDMYRAPGGFVIYSRNCFEKTRPVLDTYMGDEESILEVFKCEIVNEVSGQRVRRGEDVYFFEKYKSVGGKIWCEPNINLSHWGVKSWEGNYQEHLLNCRRNSPDYQPHRPHGEPLVSVVIPCYNHAEYLPDAIESALNQTYPNIEVVVVNDGSTDNTRDVALRYAEKYPNVRYMEQSNKGLGITRNTGIKVAKGEWILPLDADDMVDPTFVSKCLETDADIISTYQKTFGDAEETYHFMPEPKYKDFLVMNQINCASLFRREMWEKLGGYNEFGRGYEDYEFWLRATKAGYKVKVVPEPLMFYRKHGPSMVDLTFQHHDEMMDLFRSLGHDMKHPGYKREKNPVPDMRCA